MAQLSLRLVRSSPTLTVLRPLRRAETASTAGSPAPLSGAGLSASHVHVTVVCTPA
jgi:hypothetical protein